VSARRSCCSSTKPTVLTANGSTLVGQNWAATKCPGNPLGSCVFNGRPDDTGPYAANPKDDVSGGDNPLVANGVSGESGATNLGPRSKVLLADTKALVAYWHKLGVDPTPDLVTTSGSGVDPDISALDATVQIPMVSKATGISPDRLRTLIRQQTHPAQWGFMGSSYIDVLQLNEGLAKLEK
jgi:K+-transporting ATPase ATPase C chain